MHEQMVNPRILIVEDEKIVALDIRRRLEAFNYQVVGVVDTGEAALVMAAEYLPDLVLMDIILKGEMDGIEAATIIGERFDIPYIFLTASSDEASLDRAKLSGPFGYIIKPFEARDLKSALEIALYNSRVDRKLKESELWLHATLNSINDAVIATDMEKRIRFMNPAAERFLSLEADKYTGKSILEIYSPIDDASNELLIAHIHDGVGLAGPLNKILKTKSGQTCYIEETISLIRDRKDAEQGYVYTLRDVTRRRSAEMAAIASRDFYLSVFEEFPTPVWRSNTEGKFNYFNKTWLNFTGRDIENEIFTGWLERMRAEDRERFNEAFHAALQSKSRFEVEFELLNRDDVYRWIICIGTPIFGIDGTFHGFIGACIDISHMILAQNELMKAKNAAESANMAKARFLSNMSHEVRTPLNGIIGILNLLETTKADKEQLEYTRMAQNAAYTLLELLNNLLDYTKIEVRKEKPEITEFNLLQAVQEILPPFQYQAKSKRIKFVIEQLPDEGALVHTDKVKIQQILINLLSNASKFTVTGSITLRVTIDDAPGSVSTTAINISVKDTGVGIAGEHFEKIFESFTQVDSSSTRRHGGAGLGLTIVKSIVDSFNGSVWVESELKSGSTFHVLIPLPRRNTNIH